MKKIFCFISLIFYAVTSFAYSIQKVPAPSWAVKPNLTHIGSLHASLPPQDGMNHLYISKQVYLGKNTVQTYYSYAIKIINRAGLDNNAFIQLDYDSSITSLAINSINIIRNGKVINALYNSPIHSNQQESDLAENIYDNVKTVTVTLNDLRVNDIVVYSFTKTYKEDWAVKPFSNLFIAQLPFHTNKIYLSLINASGHQLYFKYFHTDIKPIIKNYKTFKKYIWLVENSPPLELEPDMPSWYDPISRIQVATMDDWQDLSAYLSTLFTQPARLSPDLQNKIQEIRKHHSTKLQQLQAVYDYIQKNIHYVGLEIGMHNIKPTSPNIVFKRGYGDCKDMAYLMTTMLRRLNIEAHVALVNTDVQKHIINLLPSIDDFDHAIVLAKINTKKYWLDATRASPSTTLGKMYIPNFGYALVMNTNTNGLTPVDPKNKSITQIKTLETYIIPNSIDGDSILKFNIKYSGREAAVMRAYLSERSQTDLSNDYMNTIRDYYSSATQIGHITIINDAKNNVLIASFTCKLIHPWKFDSDSQEYYEKIAGIMINEYLQPVTPYPRKMLLGLLYPLKVNEHIIVKLPKPWAVDVKSFNLSQPPFELHKHISYSNKILQIDYQYKNNHDSVNLSQMKAYYNAINEIQDNHLSNFLTKRDY